MPKNLLFILSDEHRYDALGYINPIVKTPNLDRLAKNGIAFNHAYTVAQACVPSRACILTGKYQHQNGMVSNSTILPRNAMTWPRHLCQNGYQSVAVGRTHHIDAGFDNVIRVPSGDSYMVNCHSEKLQCFWREGDWNGPSEAPFEEYYEARIAKTAIEFLREFKRGEMPFALYVGFIAPHSPNTPPEPYWSMYKDYVANLPQDNPPPKDIVESMARIWGMDKTTQAQFEKAVRAYYGLVSTMDAAVGMLLDELEQLQLDKDTLVIYTSDHGEMLGDKQLFIKGYGYDASARIPFIAQCPGTVVENVKTDAMLETVDIAPTICEALGVPPMKIPGRSAWKVMTGEKTAHRNWVYSDLYTGFMYRDLNYKWIHRCIRGENIDEVYDMKSDPRENNNLVETDAGKKVIADNSIKMINHLVLNTKHEVTDYDPTAIQPPLRPFFTT